jgi:hypothetical protein
MRPIFLEPGAWSPEPFCHIKVNISETTSLSPDHTASLMSEAILLFFAPGA